jgi:hypothetical protein
VSLFPSLRIPLPLTKETNGIVPREFAYDPNNETDLVKELVLQVRKVIGPFAAPKKIFIVSDLPKTRSGKVRYLLLSPFNFVAGDYHDAERVRPSLDHAPHHAKDRSRRG